MHLRHILFFIFIGLAASVCHGSEEPAGIHLFPESLLFWNIAQGDQPERKLFVRQGDGHRVKILSVKSMGGAIEAKVVESSGLQKMAHTIDVKLKLLAAGSAIEDAVIIETDHPDFPLLLVPVKGNVLDGITVDPQSFGMIVNRQTHLATGAIQISSTDNSEFEITEITTSMPTLHTKVVPMEECCGYFVAVLLNDSEQHISKPQQATLHINTTSKQGVIVIPVMLRPSSTM